jgi:aldehyde:ferredoxin oxidoreductase
MGRLKKGFDHVYMEQVQRMSTGKFRLAEIDLSSGTNKMTSVPDEDYRSYLGGSALGARLAFNEIGPEIDALSPEAPIFVMTGPLTGTGGPAVGRFVICAKSPATGLWGESHCGGFFGRELRAAGVDGVKITGKATEPSYIFIRNGEIMIRPATHLWGTHDTYQTQAAIQTELEDGRVRVASIGLAGESQLRIGNVLCDHGRFAGRTGMGAVMGSKQLKAIAVRGTQPIPIAQKDRFSTLRSEANINLKKDTVTLGLREAGTASIADYLEYLGEMPKRYFTGETFEAVDRVSGSAMAETILSNVSSCHGCVIACGRRVKLKDGVERKGPEYETIVGFGPNLCIDDLEAITMLGEICDQYGMDTISLSSTIGLAVLMYERGLITDEDTGGITLQWGDPANVMDLVHMTARREGFGAHIAEGALKLATRFGDPEMAAQVNGLELGYHDPRGSSGMALVYATSPRGACHNQSDYFMVDMGQSIDELGIDFIDRQAGAEKAAYVARHQDWVTIGNALVICVLANVPPQMVADLTGAATGYDMTVEEMLEIGERGWNLKRAINNRLGVGRSNDRLPRHLMTPLEGGGSADYVPPLEEMLAAYYEARAWDPDTGRPVPERLEKLGLSWIIPHIWPTEQE